VTVSEVFVPEANVLDFAPLWALAGLPGPRRRRGGGNGAARGGQAGAPAGGQAGDSADGQAEAAPDGQPGGPRPDGNRLPALTIALAVIASVYLGAAGGMRDRALRMAAARDAADPIKQRLAGLLTHEFRSAWWALDALIDDTTDESIGSEEHFIVTMLAKRQVILSSIRIVELAMELLGSRSYMRGLPFEQALRDVRAGITHPLAPEKTLLEIGKDVLGFFADVPAS
jgi:hypothetical protein